MHCSSFLVMNTYLVHELSPLNSHKHFCIFSHCSVLLMQSAEYSGLCYCDVVLQEYVKAVIQTQCTSEVHICQNIMYACIDAGLRLLSPFMPYVTEELYQRLLGRTVTPSIVVAPYPQPRDVWWYFLICYTSACHIHGAGGIMLWVVCACAHDCMHVCQLAVDFWFHESLCQHTDAGDWWEGHQTCEYIVPHKSQQENFVGAVFQPNVPLLMAASAFSSGRSCWSFPRHCTCTISIPCECY